MINKDVNLLRKHDLWNYELYNLTTTNQVLDFLKKMLEILLKWFFVQVFLPISSPMIIRKRAIFSYEEAYC